MTHDHQPPSAGTDSKWLVVILCILAIFTLIYTNSATSVATVLAAIALAFKQMNRNGA